MTDFLEEEYTIADFQALPILQKFHDAKIDINRIRLGLKIPIKKWKQAIDLFKLEAEKPFIKQLDVIKSVHDVIEYTEMIFKAQYEQISVLHTTMNAILDEFEDIGQEPVASGPEKEEEYAPAEKPKYDPLENDEPIEPAEEQPEEEMQEDLEDVDDSEEPEEAKKGQQKN